MLRLHDDFFCDRPPNLISPRAIRHPTIFLPSITTNRKLWRAHRSLRPPQGPGSRAVVLWDSLTSAPRLVKAVLLRCIWAGIRYDTAFILTLRRFPIIAPSCTASLPPLHYLGGLSDCHLGITSHTQERLLDPYTPIANRHDNRKPKLPSPSSPSS